MKKSVLLDERLNDLFKNVTVNIPLLDCIADSPKYKRFIIEAAKKNRLTPVDPQVNMTYAMQPLCLPEKLADPGTPHVTVLIGRREVRNALLDLGSGVNMMPLCLFKELGLEPYKVPGGCVLEMADKSTRKPYGLVRDILIRLDSAIFPTDFMIMDVGVYDEENPTIILGRP